MIGACVVLIEWIVSHHLHQGALLVVVTPLVSALGVQLAELA